jgi:hypothetical protein
VIRSRSEHLSVFACVLTLCQRFAGVPSSGQDKTESDVHYGSRALTGARLFVAQCLDRIET